MCVCVFDVTEGGGYATTEEALKQAEMRERESKGFHYTLCISYYR